ncbi:hypothetical protein HYW11_00780, partial [Candidatus Peregrinibacteria bacterium]|nr:hypothetical protein [Candidatus Peregrinibacteria bacterium]
RAHGREGRGGKRNIYRPPLSSSLPTGERTRALQTIGHCTERLIAGESPLIVFSDHHRAQVALGVVPELVQKLIADIEQTGGAAKVIGAGGRISGGGMVFALHQKRSTLTNLAKKHGFQLTTRIAKTSIAAWQSG